MGDKAGIYSTCQSASSSLCQWYGRNGFQPDRWFASGSRLLWPISRPRLPRGTPLPRYWLVVRQSQQRVQVPPRECPSDASRVSTWISIQNQLVPRSSRNIRSAMSRQDSWRPADTLPSRLTRKALHLCHAIIRQAQIEHSVPWTPRIPSWDIEWRS